MAISKQNKKEISDKNRDLKERMIKETWKVTYDKEADILTMGGKFPKDSGNIYIDEKLGSMIRVGEDKRIYGFIIENYKNVFLKESKDSWRFWLAFLPYTSLFGRLFFLPLHNLLYYLKFYHYVLRGFVIFKEKIVNSKIEKYGDLLIKNELASINRAY